MNIFWILTAIFLIQRGKSCTVDVIPKWYFASFRENVTLNCISDCSSTTWESRFLKHNTTKIGNIHSVLVEVDDWEKSEINCLGDSDTISFATVIAYALPSRVELDMEEKMVEDKEYEATCHVYDVAPANFVTLSLQINGEIFLSHTFEGYKSQPAGLKNLTKSFTFKADRQQMKFACNATMNLTNIVNTTVLSSPVNVSVYYPPAFTSCPESIVWVEGSNTFDCLADGNPTPHVQCNFNNRAFQPPEDFNAERNMSGVYECEASNTLKNISRTVNLTVQYPPGSPDVINSANSTVSKGASISLSCYADALPPPVYHWKIPPQATVTYSSDNSTIFIEKASSDHNGNYTCEVSNSHGQSKREEHLEVEKDYYILWIILAVCGGVLAILVIFVIVYYCNKIGKKGFYDLMTWGRGNPHTALPLDEKSDV